MQHKVKLRDIAVMNMRRWDWNWNYQITTKIQWRNGETNLSLHNRNTYTQHNGEIKKLIFTQFSTIENHAHNLMENLRN